jgi:hypothetical protein
MTTPFSVDDLPQSSPLELVQADILAAFERMDQYLVAKRKPLEMVLIGSAILIVEGMPSRGTMDIDVWKTEQLEEEGLLAEMAQACGLDIDPAYEEAQKPHLSLVSNDFIEFPEYDKWKDDRTVFWQGQALTLFRPPVGIMLASKVAAWRGKDFRDIDWILDTYRDWKNSLAQYLPHFGRHTRKQYDKNQYLFDYHVESKSRPALTDPEQNANLILPSKPKP